MNDLALPKPFQISLPRAFESRQKAFDWLLDNVLRRPLLCSFFGTITPS
jgi:hypothetical protein